MNFDKRDWEIVLDSNLTTRNHVILRPYTTVWGFLNHIFSEKPASKILLESDSDYRQRENSKGPDKDLCLQYPITWRIDLRRGFKELDLNNSKLIASFSHDH